MLLTSSSSKAIIRENFIRFWPVPVLTLLSFFLTGMLPIIMNYRAFEQVGHYAASYMSGGNFLFNFVLTLSAIIASAACFGYLHDPVNTSFIHAMPATRKKLFAGSALSCWLFVVISVIITSVLMLTMAGASPGPDGTILTDPEFGRLAASEIFTVSHCLGLIVTGIVTATFVCAVCCLSAVVTGKTHIHVLLSMFLIVLPAALLEMIELLCREFLVGFGGMNIKYDYLSVLIYDLTRSSFSLEPGRILYFLAIALVMYISSYYIYTFVKLERVGSACTFPVVSDVLCIILTFMMSVGFADLFVALSSDTVSKSRFTIVSILASVVFYLIMRMTADSTPAVFNLKTLKKFCVYLAVLAIFLLVVVADVTGYHARAPRPDSIASVSIETSFQDSAILGVKEYTDEGVIQAALDLQHALIAEGDKDSDEANFSESVYITWHLSNGNGVARKYTASFGEGFEQTEAAFKELYDQPAFRENIASELDDISGSIRKIELYSNENFDADGEQLSAKVSRSDWAALTKAVRTDLMNRSYEEARSTWDSYSILSVEIYTDESFDDVSPYDDGQNSYLIYEFDEETLKFLKDKGYLKQLEP